MKSFKKNLKIHKTFKMYVLFDYIDRQQQFQVEMFKIENRKNVGHKLFKRISVCEITKRGGSNHFLC